MLVLNNMAKLPVIVGLGGLNAAGRTSGFHSYKRMVCDALSAEEMAMTWCDLAHRMQLPVEGIPSAEAITQIKLGTLVRRIEAFDPDKVLSHRRVEDSLIPEYIKLAVSSAGSIPAGINLDGLYNAHHHPRGLKLTIYGISDALNSLGLEWAELLTHIAPTDVSVYAGSALSQVDEYSLAGLVGHPLKGQRVTSKMMPFSLAEMPADFVNSYVLNSVGATGHNMGACATFLYNLKLGLQDIQSGRARVVFVGCAEAPIVPEIIEGFRVMSALATDEALCALDGVTEVDNRRACRPFSTNVGFTLAESVQFCVLMDDALALELGLTIYGAVAGVFVNADGNKKSIAGPGVGNYVTVAQAVALAKAILGDEGLQHTFVQAHGTGTPQNRTTESHIFNEVAKTFAISQWPVTAIKSYVGHSISVAAGDQLMASLGVWQYGWIPGIKTIDHIATDVYQSNLTILQDHYYAGMRGEAMQAAIINSKGFGGNNATALVLSPAQTLKMLEKKYGHAALAAYHTKHQAVAACAAQMDARACQGQERIVYRFGETVMDQSSVTLSPTAVRLSAFNAEIPLVQVNPYADYS
jgi:acetoacetyl-[acyl-carrier protein] synthase